MMENRQSSNQASVAMTSPSNAQIQEPFPISCVAGRYLLFDIDVITYLRRSHHILGVLIGSIPQIPQQNVFLGLPVQLLPEEARLLVEKEIAYIIEDTTWHKSRFSTLQGEDRERYLESLRFEGWKAKRVAEAEAKKRSEKAIAKQAPKRALENTQADLGSPESSTLAQKTDAVEISDSLFEAEGRPQSRSSVSATRPTSDQPYGITRTTTIIPSHPLPTKPSQIGEGLPIKSLYGAPLPQASKSYPLFAHLQAHDYYITPGLRFGCDYTVYPGDPLRFHSHFLATGYEWEEEIPMLDLVGGGRLGTGVKKGFMIGGEKDAEDERGRKEVRTFCLEWGGM